MKKLMIYSFIFILFAGGILNLLFHTDQAVSHAENRSLQQMPGFSFDAYFSGEFTSSLDTYISDQFAFRTNLMKLSKKVEGLKGLPSEAIEVISVRNDNSASKPQEEEHDMATVSNPVRQSEFIITSERAFANHISNPLGEYHYAKELSSFALRHPELNLYLMLPPTKTDFYTPEEYLDLTDNQYTSVLNIQRQLDSDINFIDVHNAMSQHTDEYIYLNTDHHWTALGAYYAYCKFAEEMNLPTFDLTSSEKVIVEDFLGSIYTMTQSETIRSYPDTLIGYAPDIPVKMVTDSDRIDYEVVGFFGYASANYGMFLNGDAGLKVINSESEQAIGKILLIKDSYANAFIPYLVYNYEEIHIIDPRHFSGSLDDYIREQQLDTVLFFNSAGIGKYDTYHEILESVFKEVE
jgi:hypothetical protein